MEEHRMKVLKYISSYTDAQKKATKKYRDNNKDKVNEQRKKYYENRKAKDPNFLLYKRQKAKEYYTKKKERLKEAKEEEVKKALEQAELAKVNEELKQTEPEVLEHPIVDETVDEKKTRKRKYTKRNKTV